MGRTLGLLAAVLAAAVTASSASAAVTIGETFAPVAEFTGAGGLVQRTSPANGYAAPSPGVITSWSYQAAAPAPPPMKLKVHRLVSGNDFLIVGASQPATPTANALNTFQTRITVQAGDMLGAFYSGTSLAGRLVGADFAISEVLVTDPAPGSTATFSAPGPGFQADLSAKLEPDADNDGFGDETQDQCPSDATKQVECVPPETTITVKPKAKSKKKKARFEFTSSEAGSSFECSLDGGPFAPCTSPHTVKVKKKGKHTFAVRARDAAGNLDATPATYSWKYKPKKKKKK